MKLALVSLLVGIAIVLVTCLFTKFPTGGEEIVDACGLSFLFGLLVFLAAWFGLSMCVNKVTKTEMQWSYRLCSIADDYYISRAKQGLVDYYYYVYWEERGIKTDNVKADYAYVNYGGEPRIEYWETWKEREALKDWFPFGMGRGEIEERWYVIYVPEGSVKDYG